MALQHELRAPRARVPELDAAVFGAGEDPGSVGGKGDAEDEVLESVLLANVVVKGLVSGRGFFSYLVAFVGLDAPSALGSRVGVSSAGSHKLPHLNSPVQGTRDEILAVRGEGDRVDGVLVSIRALEALDEISSSDIPDPDALVEGSSSDVARIGGDGNGGDAILNAERHDVVARLNVPQADRAVTASRGNGAAVLGEVEGVDVLLVTGEGVADLARGNVPDADQLVLGTCREVLAVGAEADTADVQVASSVGGIVLENADLLSSVDIEDLGRSVAASGDVLAIVAEAHAADDALVLQSVEQINVKNPWNLRVEDGEPIRLDLLLVVWEALEVQLCQCIANISNVRVVRRPWDGAWSLLMVLGTKVWRRWRTRASVWATLGDRSGRRRWWRALGGVAVLHRWRAILASWLEWTLCGRRRTLLESWWLWHLVLWRSLVLWCGLRRETWASLALAGHDASEKVAWAMANRWRRCLSRPNVLGWSTSS